MMMMMMMEQEMEVEENEVEVFEVLEVDLDYEYDAARWFDFSRQETEAETREAELWFESATSYPHSPFVAKLLTNEDISCEDVCNSTKPGHEEEMPSLYGDNNITQELEFGEQDQTYKGVSQLISETMQNSNIINAQSQKQGFMSGSCKGLTFYNHFAYDDKKTASKSNIKMYSQRTSTLMKPTASQLAKRNQRHQVGSSRFQKPPSCSNIRPGVESQAPKRQKLDGGHSRKIDDMKQQTNLMHKLPKKDGFKGICTLTRTKLTIPREPELVTANRVHRVRSTSSKAVEDVTAHTGRFKARPLNRKIFEAPTLPLPKRSTPSLPEFQVFQLKTMERAKQHMSTAPSFSHGQNHKLQNQTTDMSSFEDRSEDSKRSDHVTAGSEDERRVLQRFKARPLDKKIFSSKGDMGVFRNVKRDVTVPQEFNFQKEKKIQHNPPTDLFSKLSLATELQSRDCTKLRVPQPTRSNIFSKGSKENRWSCFQQDHNVKHSAKEMILPSGGKQACHVGIGGIDEKAPRPSVSRIFGVW